MAHWFAGYRAVSGWSPSRSTRCEFDNVSPGQSADLAERLACEHDWFADFKREGDRAHLLTPTELDGVTVRVRELTGSAGDGWLMHPWLLQGKAPNASDRVRHMMTLTISGPGCKIC